MSNPVTGHRVTDLTEAGRIFLEAREDAGRSQRDVAEAIGLHQPKMPAIERGEYGLSADHFIRLAHELGLTVTLDAGQQPHLVELAS